MSKGLLGTKVGMTQVFGEDGSRLPVTVIQAGPCTVVRTLTQEKDKYTAIQVGFGEFPKAAEGKKPRWEKVMSKAEVGVFTKAGVTPLRHLRELRVSPAELEGVKAGDQLKVDLFKPGQIVDVVGTSKGKGFAGVVFRHNMAGQGAPQSHGVHEYHRHVGAVGQRKTPGRTFKGKRMPGHLGVERITVQNLTVVGIDAENNLLLVKGAVPGHKGSLVSIFPAVKAKTKA